MLPQRFRPTVASVMARTAGSVNLERVAAGITSVAYWLHFSRWCHLHPVSGLPSRMHAANREQLWESIIEKVGLSDSPILYLEFGVYRGKSMAWWLERISHPDSRFIGFDTFTGMPERWRRSEPLGWFNANGQLPDIQDPRCRFEAGLFQDTLPGFINRTELGRRLVLQLDADLYTATLFVLARLAPYLKPGDILFFDEFSCPLDEYRAFQELVRCFHVKYEFLGATPGYTRVCLRIL